MRADQNVKLFERSEFLPFPLPCVRRGKFRRKAEPRNTRGGLSLVRFFVPHKEMNEQFLKSSGFRPARLCRNWFFDN